MLDRFFVQGLSQDPLLWQQHDPWLVALSIVVSMGASAIALHLAVLAREAGSAARRQMALASGALALASGVWTMHYVGMLAFAVCGQARFNLWLTALSVLPCLAASWVALRLLVQERVGTGALLAGALLVGAGIGSMHYIGMAASELAPLMVYDLQGFVLSLVVAVLLAGLALWVRFGLQRALPQVWQRHPSRGTALAGVVMGLAIAGMHYTGMAALRFYVPIGEFNQVTYSVPVQTSLSLSIAAIVFALGLLLLAANASRRYHDMLQQSRRDQEQLNVLVANLPGTAFRCANGGDWPMLFASAAIEDLTGYPPQAFLQREVDFGQLVESADRLLFEPQLEHALHQGLPYHIEYRIRTRSGQTRWVAEYGRGSANPEDGTGWIDGVLLDTTEAHARSAELEGTLAAIERSRPAAQFDADGDLIGANDQYLALLGYEPNEVLGLHHSHFCPTDFVQSPAYATLWAQLRAGQFHTGEAPYQAKDGSLRWLLASYNPVFDAEGKLYKILQFASDMTERRAMEQELRAAKERAETAAAARASFLANMSHEIRTPMNAIIGFSEALLDGPLDASQRRQLGTVHASARSLLRLLNDILDTAKLDKGAVTLELQDFSLRQLCQQMLDSLRINAQRKGLALVLDYPDQEPEFFYGDALRVQQVLLNLLGNAVKFTEVGQVLLRLRYAAGVLHIDVQDSGIGMSDAQLARIFDPFAQADASTTRRFGGTGLGTTIAQQLATLMQGRIEVRSTPGAGSTFSVYLPLPLGQAVAPVGAPSAQEVALAPLRILAVDDVPANLELLQLALGRAGHQIDCASDGAQALAASAAQHYDLVLMDLHMPTMDGMEAARQIRAREQSQGLARLPIIALSASVLDDDQNLALAAGMDGFAHKPLDLPRLYAEMARVLGLQASATGAESDAHHEAASAPTDPIDWRRGEALWGTQAALTQALERFAQEHAALPQTLEQALAQTQATGDAQTVAALAHRLRGAAGNLALGALHTLLGQLEAAAHAADAPAMAQAAAALLPAWEAWIQALAQHAAATPAATPEPSAPVPLDESARARLLATIDQAQRSLRGGELPDAALAQLAQGLAPEQLAPLQAALDRFDLDTAQQALAQLRCHLQDAAP